MSATREARAFRTPQPSETRTNFGVVLTLTVTLACAAFLWLMSLQLLLVHPGITGLNGVTGLFNQQNQKVKTDLYVVTFVVLLPVALLLCSRLVDTIGAGPNGDALPVFAAAAAGSLAALLVLVRLSGALPWGSGVKGVLAAVVVWSLFAALALWRSTRKIPSEALRRLASAAPVIYGLTAALLFALLLCVTSTSLTVLPLLIGGALAGSVLSAYGRISLPHLGRRGLLLDALVIIVLLLAIPDLVVFRDPTGIPNFLFDPGLVQFQHDWLLGPTNQLLGGGALLVGDPLSQYGVGLIYFMAGWFHLAPIGYGTFGILDGILTALFYACGYAVLRLAGVRRLLAAAAIVLGVLAFVYNFQFFVGQLPEEGPLRFGLPMVVVLGFATAQRFPARARLGRVAALIALGISAVWALEAFAYTAFTYLTVVASETWLAPPGERRELLGRRLAAALAASVIAQLGFALATLIGSGHLPDWGQYLAYVHEFLFGGTAGTITYGFANWSPGLAMGAGTLVSTAAVVLLAQRKPAAARAHAPLLVALAGTTAYSIALLSYIDNRSSTYLLLYVALPLLLAATLWLAFVLSPATPLAPAVRRAALAAGLTVAVLLFAGAWPSIGGHFSRSALARAYPGGGLTAALHRLWHPPPIDPRAPVGIRLLDRYVPGKRAIILLPTLPDLGDEILIRGRRANLLPIGDPKADGLVQSVWLPRVRAALARLQPGQLILTDQRALAILPALRNPRVDPLRGAIAGGGVEVEWILQALDRRFRIVPVARGSGGLIVARLVSRGDDRGSS